MRDETEDSSMSQAKNEHDAAEVNRLLAGAAKAIGSVRYCWLATAAGAGGRHPRPMGRLPKDVGDDEWMIRFVSDGRSNKASELRRDDKVTIIFQNAPDDAFVTLIGAATLRERASEDGEHWKKAYEVYFPSEQDRANAIFIEVNVQRMELWIRGVTPEPFGLRKTVLERDAEGGWSTAVQ
jgi:general stress protein 26